MEELEVDPGEGVQLVGRRGTVARAFPAAQGDPDDVVRVDGNVRANLNAGIDDVVEASRVEPSPAESVAIALPQYRIRRGAEPFVHRSLLERPVIRGDTIHTRLLGQPFVFLVTRTTPSGPVVVTEDTELTIRDEPITDEDAILRAIAARIARRFFGRLNLEDGSEAE